MISFFGRYCTVRREEIIWARKYRLGNRFLNVAPLTLNVREEAHKEIIKQTQSWLSFSAKGVSAVLEQLQSPISIVTLTRLRSTKSAVTGQQEDSFIHVALYVHDSNFPLLIKRVGSKSGNTVTQNWFSSIRRRVRVCRFPSHLTFANTQTEDGLFVEAELIAATFNRMLLAACQNLRLRLQLNFLTLYLLCFF